MGLAVFLASGSGAQALSWKAYDAHRHERFKRGLPSKPEPNSNFLAAQYDLSGIGWDSADGGKTVALISPQHFVGAKHWQLKGSVSFLGRDGKVRSYEVERHETIAANNDISIGVLKKRISASEPISFYRLAGIPAQDWYLGRTVFSFGQKGAAGRALIKKFFNHEDGAMTQVFLYDGLQDEPKGDGVKGASGDSGAPSFLEEKGQLVLFGHHHKNVLDSFLPGYLLQIAAILSRDGYELKPAAAAPGPGMSSKIKLK